MARLEIIAGPDAGKTFLLSGLVLLGRSSDNAIYLSDVSASRRHALVIQRGADFVIEDLHSTNGTFVEEQRLPPKTPYPLQDGAEIRAGTTRMIFHTQGAAEHYDTSTPSVVETITTDKQYSHLYRIFDLVTTYPSLFLVACLLFAAVFCAYLPSVRMAHNVDAMALTNNPEVEFYNNFKDIFHDEEFFVVAFEKEDIFIKENILLIRDITDQLKNVQEVKDVKSITHIDDTIGSSDTFTVKKFLDKIPETKQELEKLKNRAIQNPLYVNTLISSDARSAAIVVFAYDRPTDAEYRKNLITKTNQILEPYRQAGHQFHLAGWTTTNLGISQYMERDMKVFIPVTYMLIALTVWCVFRSLILTLLALTNISICLASTMGVFGMSGVMMNPVTSIIPPLIMALALSETIHIFSHMDLRVLDAFPDRRQAMNHILKEAFLPCFLTVLTSTVGFVALAVSQIPAIREFAYVAAVGSIFEFLYAFFLMPPILLLFEPAKLYHDYDTHVLDGFSTIIHGIHTLVVRHNKLIIMVICILILVAGWFTTKITVDTNLIEYFKKSSPVRSSMDFAEKRLSGVNSLDISLQASEEDAFKDPVNLKVMENLQNYIKLLKSVDVTISLVDFLKNMNKSFHREDQSYYTIPESKKLITQYLLIYGSGDIEDFVNESYDHARISVRISEHSSAKQVKLIEAIRSYVQKTTTPNIDIKITGRVAKEVSTIEAIVQSQLSSLEIAAIAITVIMTLIAFRSLFIGFLSLIPNICPLILNFGVMGALGIPLNTATALISTVALGLAVDNTIHFLSEYQAKRAHNISIAQAVEDIIFNKGRALLSSSFILCIGFGVLILASFEPIVDFGMLSAIIMLIDVILDMFLMPSLLLLRK
ncbi:MAG TPA: MMPL family transporter [Nitrososphaera sp.]